MIYKNNKPTILVPCTYFISNEIVEESLPPTYSKVTDRRNKDIKTGQKK